MTSKNKPWTEEELEILASCMSITEATELLPDRTRNAINLKMSRMGLNVRSKWTQRELDILTRNYNSYGKGITILLKDRSWDSIRKKVSRLKKAGVKFHDGQSN